MKKQVKIIIFVVILLVIVIGIVTIVNNNNNNNNKERRVNDYCNKYGLYGNFVYNNKIEIKNDISTSKKVNLEEKQAIKIIKNKLPEEIYEKYIGQAEKYAL